MFDKLIDSDFFVENLAQFYFKQIIQAVAYLHRKGIIHKDLNVEHIQLLKTGLYVNLKLTEFGHSRRVSAVPLEENIIGDIYY